MENATTTLPLTADTRLVVEVQPTGLVITVAGSHGDLVTLTIPPQQGGLASLSMPGLDVNLYKSTIDGLLVVDLLTATDGIVEHTGAEQPLIRVNINDDTVHDLPSVAGPEPTSGPVRHRSS
jgi:hypothetical protein